MKVVQLLAFSAGAGVAIFLVLSGGHEPELARVLRAIGLSVLGVLGIALAMSLIAAVRRDDDVLEEPHELSTLAFPPSTDVDRARR